MPDKLILVCGATGRQGGAVVRALLRDKWQVRGLTRDPSKPQARQLQHMGIEVIRGNMGDRDDLEACMDGCYGVFSVQDWEAGADEEIRQGCLVAAVAKDLGVEHLIYSSVGGADRGSGIPHFESKWEIEQYIADLRIDTTILRPTFFYDNFTASPMREGIVNGVLAMPMQPDKTLQMIATDDIGAFAALALGRPEQFRNKALELAGDEQTIPRVAQLLSEVLQRPVRFQQVDVDELAKTNPEYAVMFEWFNESGYAANIQALRELYPPLQDLRTWLHQSSIVPRLTQAA